MLCLGPVCVFSRGGGRGGFSLLPVDSMNAACLAYSPCSVNYSVKSMTDGGTLASLFLSLIFIWDLFCPSLVDMMYRSIKIKIVNRL